MAKLINDGKSADASVVLTQDIDIKGEWTPLGKNAAYPFKGSFDGGNHSVKVTVDNPNLSYFGFFGCLDNAEVKNLTVCGEVYCSEPYAFVGGIAARARGNVTIENCTNRATVSALARGNAGTGGIVGGYDDGIEYRWEDIRLLVKDCENAGLIIVTGSDSDAYVGGIAGKNANCIQLENCTNSAAIYAPKICVGGLLGQAGYRTGDCEPSIQNCVSSGTYVGADGKTNRLYGKGSISAANIVNSGGNTYSGSDEISDKLLCEAQKYSDVIAMPQTAEVGDSLEILKSGMTPSEDITVSCSQGERDIAYGYIDCDGSGIKAAKLNETGKTVEETATLRFEDADGNALRKPVTVSVYPSTTDARTKLMNNIAKSYSGKSGEWVVFDSEVYSKLGFGENVTDKTNYLNLTVNALSENSALATDRAKAEIILSALDIDTANLTAHGSEESYSNAARLAEMNLGSSKYSAPWILLAEEAGNLELSDTQRESLISDIISAQGENGLFYSVWGGDKYDDVDTTGTALAALARFYDSRDDVKAFADKAISGLSNAQGENGSYGNINSDAMVITGLAAMGISPSADARFVKNGCSLASAVMLYANDSSDGFVTSYVSGSNSEKASALATEQGFRALIVLEQLEKCTAFNVYTLEVKGGTEITVPAKSAYTASATGEVELPDDVTIDGSDEKNITAVLYVYADKDTQWLANTVSMPSGATAADLIKKAFADAGMTAVGVDDGYITSVTHGGTTLAAFDRGPYSGWMYKVNGKLPSVGITDFKLNADDVITLYYTSDYTKEDEIGEITVTKVSSAAA